LQATYWGARSLGNGRLIVSLAAILGLSAIPDARAACPQNGTNVVCDGSNTRFGTGTENGLTVQALATATFASGNLPTIWLNNNNTVTSAATVNSNSAGSAGILAWGSR
jgi:hypothetical protein